MAGTAPSSSNCIIYYKFENNATDSTSNNNNGIVSGATYTSSGKIGGAYSFDGVNDYITVPAALFLSASEARTFTFWFNTDNWVSARYLFRQKEKAGIFSLNYDGTALVFDAYDGAYKTAKVTPPSTGTWNFIACVYDGNNIKLSLNGAAFVTTAVTATTYSTDRGFKIGSEDAGTANFDGKIDEFSVFDVALTADNITYLYNSGSPGSAQQYPFSGGAGFSGKINGVAYADISKVNGVLKSNISKIKGVDVTGSTSPFNGHATLANNIVAYYKCDTNGSFPDAVGSNDGIINGATYTSSGKIGGAYSYDGVNDGVDVGDIDITSTISVSLWFKHDITGEQVIFSKRDASYYSYELTAGTGTDNHRFRINDNAQAATFTANSTDSSFHHLVGTYDGSNIKIYYDGVLKDTTALSGNITDSNVHVWVGRRAFITAQNNFDGLIDEVGLWSRALTSTEVTDLYNSGNGLQY